MPPGATPALRVHGTGSPDNTPSPGPLCPGPALDPQHSTKSPLSPVLPLELFPITRALPKYLQGSSNSSQKWVPPALPPGAPLPPPAALWLPGTPH